jgi:hypothetical protein
MAAAGSAGTYLYARHPGRLPEMKRVFADEPLATAGKS